MPSAASSAYVTEWGTSFVAQFALNGGLLSSLTPAQVSAGASGRAVAITPNGRFAYVANSGSGSISQYAVVADGTLSPLSPASVADGGSGDSPEELAVSPAGNALYVARTNATAQDVSEFSIGSTGLLTPMATPTLAAGSDGQADDIVLSPDGASAYVADDANPGRIYEYDVAGNGELSSKSGAPSIATGAYPTHLAISPNGANLYASDYGDGTVYQFAIGPGGVLGALAPSHVSGLSEARGIAVSPGDTSVYVAQGTSPGSIAAFSIGPAGALSPLGAAAPAGNDPQGIAISPDGHSLFAADFGNAISQYSIGSVGALTAGPTITEVSGTDPDNVAVSPDLGASAAFTATAAPTGARTTFDAVTSSGAVAQYAWSFGDGSSASVTAPQVSHVYTVPGTYTVTLTVTDASGCATQASYTGHMNYCSADAAARTSASVTVGVPTPAQILAVPVAVPPIVSSAHQSRSVWREGSKLAIISSRHKHRRHGPPVGTTFSFTLNEQTSVDFMFTQEVSGRQVGHRCVAKSRTNRKRRACKRTVTAGTLSFNGHGGTNTVAFEGRISQSSKLAPGATRS